MASISMITHTNHRAVHFADHPMIHQIPTIQEMSGAERVRTWYQKKELQAIKDNIRKYIREVTSEPTPANLNKFRGLEHYTRTGMFFRRQQKDAATSAVLEEQEYQRRALRSKSDPEQLAAKYTEATRKSQDLALAWGLRDEAVARFNQSKSLKSSKLPESTNVTRLGTRQLNKKCSNAQTA